MPVSLGTCVGCEGHRTLGLTTDLVSASVEWELLVKRFFWLLEPGFVDSTKTESFGTLQHRSDAGSVHRAETVEDPQEQTAEAFAEQEVPQAQQVSG